MHDITFEAVTKVFPDDVVALDHLDLRIQGGEFFSIVGPSGCGKTTALRVLAGLEEPTGGRVLFDRADVTDLETRLRDIGLVTQSNLLLSHRSAGRNIALPLEFGGDPSDRRHPADRVRMEAGFLGVTHLLDQSPKTLSAGEKRLVQLARAIITSPSTLLMDEPLMYLEDQVRARLRSGIRRVHRSRALTTVLVTASQHDAMAMSDRIAVMFDGVVHQVATPHDVYHRPATASVAGFFGEPAMNVVEAPVGATADGRRTVDVLGLAVPVWTPVLDPYVGRAVLVGIRSEDMVVGERQSAAVAATVTATEPIGWATLARLETEAGAAIDCKLSGRPPPAGTTLDLGLRPDRFHLFDPATGLAILHPVSAG